MQNETSFILDFLKKIMQYMYIENLIWFLFFEKWGHLHQGSQIASEFYLYTVMYHKQNIRDIQGSSSSSQ